MRRQGYSYSFIREKVDVSKSTLSLWLRDVPYKPNNEVIDRIGKALAASGEAKARLRRLSISKAREEAHGEIGELNERDLFMLGIGLYIGEGAKSGDAIRVINADPAVIKLTIRWLQLALGLKKENIRIRLHIYPDNDEIECIRFWSAETGIPQSQFYKTQVDRRLKKTKKRGKLPHGTAHLSVKSTKNKTIGVFPVRKVFAWMEKVLDKEIMK